MDTTRPEPGAGVIVTTAEEWRRALGYPYYDVSNHGRVRSWHKSKGGRREKPRLLKPWINSQGRRLVMMSHEKKRRTFKVHVIVLGAFVGPCPEGMEGCHGNGDRADDRLENLRWDTRSANTLDAFKHGHRIAMRGEQHGGSKLTEVQVREIWRLYQGGGHSQRKLGGQFGVSQTAIGNIVTYQSWTHVTADLVKSEEDSNDDG